MLFDDPERIAKLVGLVVLSLLAIGCVLVLKPFLSPLIWAVILVFTTWPVFTWVEDSLGGRKLAAALVMTLGLATALVLPLVLVATGLAGSAENWFDDLRRLASVSPVEIELPEWVKSLPWLGDYLKGLAANTSAVIEALLPYLGFLRDAAVQSGLTIGRGLIEISLSVLISFFIYRDALHGLSFTQRLISRVGGERAIELLTVAGDTTRGVVYGVIGTALIQGLLAALGLWIAGVPGPVLLGALTFALALLPIGAPLVWIPASIWLFMQDQIVWGIFMLVWGAGVVSSVDNFLRPYLISMGSNLPFLLVFMGIIGGVLTFGVLGIFIGPTLLAVAQALVREWLAHRPQVANDLENDGSSATQPD